MRAVYDPTQALHRPLTRIAGGGLRPNPETPERVEPLLGALRAFAIPVEVPAGCASVALRAVHDEEYLRFLAEGFAEWRKLPEAGPELRSSVHPNTYMNRRPESLLGRAGYYQADGGCVLVEHTWTSALASAGTAAGGMVLVLDGEGPVYALCRPPGHHACRDKAGGFCYLNNAAVAAGIARGRGARVAVLDLDVHHGNGTQSIFYGDPEVLTVSVHGDPAHLYPYFAGYADERGTGAGEGANLNLPVPLMSGNDPYVAACRVGAEAVRRFDPDILILALGLDASRADPFACMQVDADGFRYMGELTRLISKPTLIVQEGGYPSRDLGLNLQAFLSGFLNA